MGFFQKDRGKSAPRSGGSKFGGSKPFKKSGFSGSRGGGSYGSRDNDRQMHEATCAECGNMARVPFKPNGSKPVLCRDCFGSGDDSPRPRRDGGGSYGSKPRFDGGAKRSFDRAPAERTDKSEKRLNELSKKLDILLEEVAVIREILSDLEIVGSDEDGDDGEAVMIDGIDDEDDDFEDEDSDEDDDDEDDEDKDEDESEDTDNLKFE